MNWVQAETKLEIKGLPMKIIQGATYHNDVGVKSYDRLIDMLPHTDNTIVWECEPRPYQTTKFIRKWDLELVMYDMAKSILEDMDDAAGSLLCIPDEEFCRAYRFNDEDIQTLYDLTWVIKESIKTLKYYEEDTPEYSEENLLNTWNTRLITLLRGYKHHPAP